MVSQPHLTIMYIDSTTIYRPQNNAHVSYGVLRYKVVWYKTLYISTMYRVNLVKDYHTLPEVQPHDDFYHNYHAAMYEKGSNSAWHGRFII